MKKTIMIISVVLLGLAAIACLLSWPTQEKLLFPGACVTADGDVLEEGSIAVTITTKNYLFRDAVLDNVDVQVLEHNYSTRHIKSELFGFRSAPGLTYEDFSFMDYDPQTNMPCSVRVFLDLERSWCLIQLDRDAAPEYYAGSIDGAVDPQTILEQCGKLSAD